MDLPILSENSCGSCRACCTVLGVKKLHKDDYTPCQHECAAGCAIYSQRPAECAKYECLWLQQNWGQETRPDQLGVILELHKTTIGPAMVVREVWQDASKSETAQAIIGEVAVKLDVFVYLVRPDNTRSAFFPPGKEHLAKKMKRMKLKYISWRDELLGQKQRSQLDRDRKHRRKVERMARKRNRC